MLVLCIFRHEVYVEGHERPDLVTDVKVVEVSSASVAAELTWWKLIGAFKQMAEAERFQNATIVRYLPCMKQWKDVDGEIRI